MKKINLDRVNRRKKRISSNIFGTQENPRISVFVSNKYTYAQIIDDKKKITLVSYSSLNIARRKGYQKEKKVDEAKKTGLGLAEKAKKVGIKKAVFDRGRYSYKGRVKALTEGLREGGITI